MKHKTKLSRILLIVGLVIASLIFILSLNFNLFIKTALERSITQSLNVQTQIETLNLNPFNGHLKVKGLAINNPSGFSAQQFLQIQDIEIQVTPSTLFSNPVAIQKFQLSDISINVEQQLPHNNVLEIFKSSNEYKQSDEAKQEKRFRVTLASVSNFTVKFSLTQFGILLGSTAINLPSVELKDLNSNDNQGLLMGEVITKLISTTVNVAVEQNKASIPKPILDILKSQKVISN